MPELTKETTAGQVTQAIAAAVSQISLAVRAVQPAVEQLGQLIKEMAAGLSDLGRIGPRDFDPEVIAVFPDEFDRAAQELERHAYVSIMQLQFHEPADPAPVSCSGLSFSGGVCIDR